MSRLEDAPLIEVTTSRYLNYALSVITSRALPDIRDGLKPVQRRILYAMFHDLHLGPDSRYKKSAKIVGEVMGNYHPHGDQSIYDAMVRMAQEFSMRYTLVDGQGNFGSLDGDPPAAMRYTEAKLAHLALELLDELKQETVPFHPTYDGTRQEPDVLPAQVPNLLINGTSGIAVGMATSIPPHNLREVVSALVALIDDPALAPEKLETYIPGPDFPTGGQITSSAPEIDQIYRTGSGTIRLRGTWKTERDGRRTYLVITSIPFGLEKSQLVERIGELISTKQIPQITDVRDESTEEVRIVCELKAGSAPETAVAFLYKNSQLATNFHVNFTCLVPTELGVCVPHRVTLAQMLRSFLDFRFDVVTRRHRYELGQLRERLHILEGFEKIFDDLDQAIAIVRKASGRPEALQGLLRAFGLSEIQANAVLDTRLYKLSRLEIAAIRTELDQIRRRVAEIEKILAHEAMRWEIVRKELLEIGDAYGDARRSQLTGPVEEVEFRKEDYIVDEDAWVVITRDGWIKRQKSFTEVESIRVREGDQISWLYRGGARQCVTLFSNAGSAYTMLIDDVPQTHGYGEPIGRYFSLGDGELLVGAICHDPRCFAQDAPAPAPGGGVAPEEPGPPELDVDDESVQPVLPGLAATPTPDDEKEEETPRDVPPGPHAVCVTRAGRTLRFPLSTHGEPSTKNGRLYCRLSRPFPADAVVSLEVATGAEHSCVATRQTRVLIYPVAQVPVLAGAGRGVIAVKLESGDEVVAAALLSPRRDALVVETSRGSQERLEPRRYRVKSRAGKGHRVFSRLTFLRPVPEPPTPVPSREAVQAAEEAGRPAGAVAPVAGGEPSV
ncbi:MAG: DNA topoisomerase 4 subunit A [Candidatus Riflebacteria bacterium]|nr:DNA topoisomerase 4 subunit A [Candidatus Riflebacteria bacterium]